MASAVPARALRPLLPPLAAVCCRRHRHSLIDWPRKSQMCAAHGDGGRLYEMRGLGQPVHKLASRLRMPQCWL